MGYIFYQQGSSNSYTNLFTYQSTLKGLIYYLVSFLFRLPKRQYPLYSLRQTRSLISIIISLCFISQYYLVVLLAKSIVIYVSCYLSFRIILGSLFLVSLTRRDKFVASQNLLIYSFSNIQVTNVQVLFRVAQNRITPINYSKSRLRKIIYYSLISTV